MGTQITVCIVNRPNLGEACGCLKLGGFWHLLEGTGVLVTLEHIVALVLLYEESIQLF